VQKQSEAAILHVRMVHIRRGKGHKDRFVPLPDLTYHGLRALWCKHRNHAPA
jgi:integrase